MHQQLNFDKEASDKIKAGVDKLANAVKVTLGPKGRNVIIERQGTSPHITKDGVTVANSINLEDPVENMGARLVKDVASKTAYEAGDGTTTATVLAQAIYNLGLEQVNAGVNPMELKKGIDMAVEYTVSRIKEMAIPVDNDEQLRQVATISANGDSKIADIVVEAVKAVGAEGVVTIEEGTGFTTKVDTVMGYQFDSGYTDPRFVNNTGSAAVNFTDPLYVVYEGKLAFMKQMVTFLEIAMQLKRPVVIVCEDIDGEALKTLIVNNANGRIQVATVRAPYSGDRKTETLQDIAAVTGATVISEDAGMKIEEFRSDMFGSSGSVIIERRSTLIIGGQGDTSTQEADVRELIENNPEENDWYKNRLSKLLGGVAVIKVGANSEVEMLEIKDRIDDALQATRAAMAEGILPGGGSVLAQLSIERIVGNNDGEDYGIDVAQKAMLGPLTAIAENAGVNVDDTIHNTLNGEHGWNARTNEWGNLVEMGVIDPAKVTRLALENAASVAGLLLTTRCVVYNS